MVEDEQRRAYLDLAEILVGLGFFAAAGLNENLTTPLAIIGSYWVLAGLEADVAIEEDILPALSKLIHPGNKDST
ncbi:MAG: hypothetical protein ABII80_02570 [bacterium]